MSLLKGGSDALRGELLLLGLEIAPSARVNRLLVEYLMRAWPSARARCVPRTGWYCNAFVLPEQPC
jgi:putative DNA primase/helicase